MKESTFWNRLIDIVWNPPIYLHGNQPEILPFFAEFFAINSSLIIYCLRGRISQFAYHFFILNCISYFLVTFSIYFYII